MNKREQLQQSITTTYSLAVETRIMLTKLFDYLGLTLKTENLPKEFDHNDLRDCLRVIKKEEVQHEKLQTVSEPQKENG